ncbi:BTAD domain-containing putative transcriptional regulator [Streptosporangium sp. NPDC002524]|uniref:AfsR/SARP family transcriptional regulator n=1 Tax=Streptosporangium sp. NPDC002524 TaxID=3154537 RepID=UPI0033265E6E
MTGSQDGTDLDLGPPRQQAIMAVLALPPGRVVSPGQLIDALWGEGPPRTATQSVYTYVAGLRRVLEPGRGLHEHSDVLARTAAGYVLRLHRRQTDVGAFADHLDASRRSRDSGDLEGELRCLDLALRLWNGQALAGIPGPFAEAERAGLHEERLVALERRAEVLLGLSRPREALPFLQELTRQHPLREKVRELLMLALHRCDRQAEALKVFEEGRRVLSEELGVDPGPGLRACHQRILRLTAETRLPPPRQLPGDLIGFVGRVEESVRLGAVLAPRDGADPPPLVVVSGAPGVGKSALAVRIAHQVKDRFPDGQLFVNLRGATPGVPHLSAQEVLGRFLRALGVPPQAVPSDVDEAATMWRSRLHAKRMLVLLDDAVDLGQIKPLLSAPHGTCLLVTSRESMVAGDDCVQRRLDRMSHAEAVAVLARLAGAERVAADPDATADLVRLCDGLPLALRIAGARLTGRPDWPVSALVARLRDERGRLHELEAGDLAVRSSLSASWRSLRDSARHSSRLAARALVLLGLLHVHDITAEVAAALLGTPVPEAERALERLVDAHLLDHDRPGHYQPHDLVRLYATELARGLPSREPLRAALRYYTLSAQHASRVRDPHRVQPAAPRIGSGPSPVLPHRVAGADEAAAWFADEEANLTAAATQAMTDTDPEIARLGVAIAFGLMWHQRFGHRATDLVSLNKQALDVSRRLDDEAIAAEALGHVAGGLQARRQWDEAVTYLERQLALCARREDPFGEQRALGNLANLHVERKRYDRVLHYAERQLRIARRIGSDVGVRYALIMTGTAHRELGDAREAVQALTEALDNAGREGDLTHQGTAHRTLGELYLRNDDPEAARHHLEAALALLRTTGYLIGQLHCLIWLSQACRLLNRLDDALDLVSEAMALAERLGNDEWKRQAREEQRAVHRARDRP